MTGVPHKNILILSYFFPPCNKVGGRRWAKFGKYLSRKNHNIHVISVDVPVTGKCPWENDIIKYKNNIQRLPYIEHRPYYKVNKSPQNFSGKIKYRISLYKEKLFEKNKKSNSIDITTKYGKSIHQIAIPLIRNKQIDTVIVTGGPFHWCYESMQLKKNFPSVNFLLDLRDFWTGGELDGTLNKTQKKIEKEKESFCISAARYIFTPAERIAMFLIENYPSAANRIKVLPHAFDSDEITAGKNVSSPDDVIRLAYGGILYQNMENSIDRLILLLKTIKQKGHKISLDIYTFTHDYSQKFIEAGLAHEVKYHSTIPPADLFEKFRRTDWLLQLRAGKSKEEHFKSTKFYELIALRKPVIYFGPEGDVSEFLQKNKLGLSGNTPVEELAEKVISNKKTDLLPDHNFNVADYTFENITAVLEQHL